MLQLRKRLANFVCLFSMSFSHFGRFKQCYKTDAFTVCVAEQLSISGVVRHSLFPIFVSVADMDNFDPACEYGYAMGLNQSEHGHIDRSALYEEDSTHANDGVRRQRH